MFFRMELEKNIKNTKTMVCTPDFILGKWGDEAYKRRVIGEGATFWDKKRLRLGCTKYRVVVAKSSLKQNMTSQHGICVPQTRVVDEKGE